MLHEQLQVGCDILFELANALGAEGVGDGLSFTRVFGAVTGIEEASLNGDEGVIVVAVESNLWSAVADQQRGTREDDQPCEEERQWRLDALGTS